MNERVEKLRLKSLETDPSISIERAVILTDFYRQNDGHYPAPLMRAHAFHHLCMKKRLYIGDDELIVGERGPEPKATPTFPEITSHSIEVREGHDARPRTSDRVGLAVIQKYKPTRPPPV